VKPQFEVGREAARRHKGVIIDPALRATAIENAKLAVTAAGFTLLGSADSRLPGPKGNVECFLLSQKRALR
jgi:23S rRNA (cytidine1920-2'-O)/16S rRNA (cytidine1409-2'-O)-methyltransferase